MITLISICQDFFEYFQYFLQENRFYFRIFSDHFIYQLLTSKFLIYEIFVLFENLYNYKIKKFKQFGYELLAFFNYLQMNLNHYYAFQNTAIILIAICQFLFKYYIQEDCQFIFFWTDAIIYQNLFNTIKKQQFMLNVVSIDQFSYQSGYNGLIEFLVRQLSNQLRTNLMYLCWIIKNLYLGIFYDLIHICQKQYQFEQCIKCDINLTENNNMESLIIISCIKCDNNLNRYYYILIINFYQLIIKYQFYHDQTIIYSFIFLNYKCYFVIYLPLNSLIYNQQIYCQHQKLMSKIKQGYIRCVNVKSSLKLPQKLSDLLDYQQSIIKGKDDKIFLRICTKKKYDISEQYMNGFASLSKSQQKQYFIKSVQFLQSCLSNHQRISVKPDKYSYKFKIWVKGPTFIGNCWKWYDYEVQLTPSTLQIKVIDSNYKIDLHDYILRKSKNTSRQSFVLEAIKPNAPLRYRISLDQDDQFQDCYKIIKLMCFEANRENIQRQLRLSYKNLNLQIDRELNLDQQNKKEYKIYHEDILQEEQKQLFEKQYNKKSEQYQSIQFENLRVNSSNHQIQKIKLRKDINTFRNMMPDYEIQKFNNDYQFKLVQCQKNYRLLQNTKNLKLYKIVIILPFKRKQILPILIDASTYRLWNTLVQFAQFKMKISSENSIIIYQKNKQQDMITFPRDYLYLRHIFVNKKTFFMIDKSYQHDNYPPQNKITRGHIHYCLWSIQQKQKQSILSIQLEMSQKGFLSLQQQQILTKKYLKQITNIQNYIKQKPAENVNIKLFFDLEQTQSNKSQKRNNKNEQFKSNLCSEISQNFYSLNNGDKEQQSDDNSEHSLQQIQIRNKMQFQSLKSNQKSIEPKKKQKKYSEDQIIEIKLDANGLAILPKDYLFKKHRMIPIEVKQMKLVKSSKDNHYCFNKDEWVLMQDGTALFINQKKIDQQKKVFKYIIRKLGQNLLSGKGILNMSLPVYVFMESSNIEKIAQSFSFAPIFLEKAAKIKDPIQRIKYTIVFTIGAGIAYLQMEKPFNPILGQTYQGWIGGCPIFCQQISHHPPITAFYLIGRGYKLYGNFQARIEVSINSGSGINYGQVVVQFDDGQKVRYRTPPGLVSGVTYGPRTFSFHGKGFYYDLENNLFTAISFNPYAKGFFSVGKQQKQVDYFQGHICKVTQQFIDEFKHAKKKQAPKEKDIISKVSQVIGRWTRWTRFDGVEYYNVWNDLPCKLIQQKYPLNSNSNYREDVIYRKRLDYQRAQIQKQRLQNIQRADRKWRQKYRKKKN